MEYFVRSVPEATLSVEEERRCPLAFASATESRWKATDLAIVVGNIPGECDCGKRIGIDAEAFANLADKIVPIHSEGQDR